MLTNRKTATKIKNGKVKRKNRHILTPNYWNTRQKEIQIDMEKPGEGYKHFLRKKDIIAFLELLPDREEIDFELDAILLDRGTYGLDGYYSNGVVAVCAWEKEMYRKCSFEYFEDHKKIFDRLDIRYTHQKGHILCEFTENQIKAFQLLHILLHELGHHHDRIHTKRKKECGRGEDYAENYACRYEEIVFRKYLESFPLY